MDNINLLKPSDYFT